MIQNWQLHRISRYSHVESFYKLHIKFDHQVWLTWFQDNLYGCCNLINTHQSKSQHQNNQDVAGQNITLGMKYAQAFLFIHGGSMLFYNGEIHNQNPIQTTENFPPKPTYCTINLKEWTQSHKKRIRKVAAELVHWYPYHGTCRCEVQFVCMLFLYCIKWATSIQPP